MNISVRKNLTLKNFSSGRPAGIKYIVVHYTANDGDTAYANTRYFKDVYRGASAHYFVDEKSIWQCVEDGDIAWHCGTSGKYFHSDCRNTNSVGVELCSKKDRNGKFYFSDETVNRAAGLVAYLMNRYKIPPENVIRHYDVTHKNCPAPFVEEPAKWNSFKTRINEMIKGDDEVTERIKMEINGKSFSVDRILKNDKNYIALSDLRGAGFEVGYEAKTKTPSLKNKAEELAVIADGELKKVHSLNIDGYNYIRLRELSDILGCFTADFENNTVVIRTKKQAIPTENEAND